MLEPLVTLVSIFQLHLRFHNYYTVIQFVFNFLFFSLFIHIYTDLAIILSTFPVYVQFNSLFLSVHSSILRPIPSPRLEPGHHPKRIVSRPGCKHHLLV